MSVRADQTTSDTKCHVQHLPEEVLEKIFYHTITLESINDNDLVETDVGGSKLVDAVHVTLVCKQWLRPARRVLYKNVVLHSVTRIILFQDTLQNEALGSLVRTIGLGDIFTPSSRKGIRRLLKSMPHLQGLSMDMELSSFFKDYPRWSRMQSLHLSECDSLHQMAQMAIHLRTLTLSGDLSADGDGVTSYDVELPQLKRLVMKDIDLTAMRDFPPTTDLLPSMPNLEILEVQGELEHLEEAATVARLARQFRKSLRTLIMHVEAGGELLLVPDLQEFAHLEYLNFQGTPPSPRPGIVKTLFQPNLTRLDLELREGFNFGQQILRLLAESTFLPHLNRCPQLVYYGHEGPSHKQKKALTKLSMKAYASLMARKHVSPAADLLMPTFRSAAYRTFVCLPSPLLFKTSLERHQQALLEEMLEAGELGDDATSST